MTSSVPVLPYLMVAPYFPPNNYVGAKRALHFATHLQHDGYRPVVITLDAAFEADSALLPLVPDVEIHRILGGVQKKAIQSGAKPGAAAGIETGSPSSAGPRSKPVGSVSAEAPSSPRWIQWLAQLPPVQTATLQTRGLQTLLDRYAMGVARAFPQVVWRTIAARCRLVYATFGPPSGVLLGAAVARLCSLPLVLDFRDPYTLEPNLRAGWSPEAIRQAEWIERWLFRSAAAVVLNTESAQKMYQTHYAAEFPPELFTCIRNHFDPALYAPNPAPPMPDDPFRILYYGHLRPSKNALLFAKAYRGLITKLNLTPRDTQLVMLGEITNDDQAEFARLGLQSYVQSHPWVPFTESTILLGKAALLLDLMGPGHTAQISGKFYDYLAARRPILSVSPNQELDGIFAETKMGKRVDLDQDAITDALEGFFKDHRGGAGLIPNEEALYSFTAKPAAEKMAAVFRRALSL